MGEPFCWRSRIRFSDTDASGRIHYSAMFRHMEAAEDEFMRSIGFPYSDIEPAAEISFPRVHVEAQFVAPLRYDDEVETQVTVERVGESSFTLYFMSVANGVAVARGRITAVCMSTRTQRSTPMPEALADALQARRG
jgi:YbgC/YbaW family acyl-CoA thioester hydrolase